MKVLVLHNHYQQAGGEDEVFAAESDLLEEYGHRVTRYTLHNDQVAGMGALSLTRATLWNKAAYGEIRALIRRERPQVAHFHNTFPLMSPAAYYAARVEGVPVVQTLHNYRLLCSSATLFREGRVCQDCLGKTLPWPGVAHSCYRGSRSSSAAVATMLTSHRALGTWTRAVDVYIALNEFSRQKFVQGGLPTEKVVVKPNFVQPDPGMSQGSDDYVLFVGRLSGEKGIGTLLAAKDHLREGARLKIVGDGPLAADVAEAAKRDERVEWLGRQPKDRVLELMKGARALIFPSLWYETFGMVIAEAYAVGLPVICGELGNMASMVKHGQTGLHFRAGDPKDLAAQIEWTAAHPANLEKMRVNARAEFEAKYTPERNYDLLMGVYRKASGNP